MVAKGHRKKTISDNLLFKNLKGEKLYLSGVNYWPRKTGPLMWSKWNPKEIRRELRQMKELGMNVNRSFLYIPDFMPTPEKVEKKMLKNFASFLDMCSEENIFTIPTFFVGHMSGEEWDFPWRDGRSLYEDEYMLEKQTMFITEVVKVALDHAAVIGWLFSNEMPNHGGEGPREGIKKWVAKMTEAVRRGGDMRPVSPGDGARSPELWGNATEWYLEDLLEQIDFIGPHIYPFDDDVLRHSYNPAFVIKMASAFKKPVILEEFGASNTMASEENQAAYFRTTLSSVFINGGVGSLGWCYSDFDLEYQRPYSHRGHEFLFGVTRKNGSVKPSGETFIEFKNILDSIDFSNTHIYEDPVSILISSYYHHPYDYISDDRNEMKNNYMQTFVGLKQAGINPRFTFEDSVDWNNIETDKKPQIPDDSEVIFSPVTGRLTAPYWRALIEYVRRGGWLYVSYKSDGWIHLFEELFGARHKLKFGLADQPDHELSIKFIQDFGSLSGGDTVKFTTNNLSRSCAYCPVEVTDAEIIAIDHNNRPALLMNKVGDGKIIFSTYPLEYYCSSISNGSQIQPLHQIYNAICTAKGIKPPLRKDNKNIELGILENKAGALYAYLINHSWNEESVTIYTDRKINRIQQIIFRGGIDLEDRSFTLKLGSKKVELFEIGLEEESSKKTD